MLYGQKPHCDNGRTCVSAETTVIKQAALARTAEGEMKLSSWGGGPTPNPQATVHCTACQLPVPASLCLGTFFRIGKPGE